MRNKTKVFYGSSYDRGLQFLLEMWPDVKKAVPDATLEIAYGWKLFDQFYSNNPSSMSWKNKMLEMMKYEGITEHGRLSQPDVAELMKSCGLWAYPTSFGEISCINAMKAQAYGCEPVVVNYAALKETVQFGKKIDGDIYDQETKDAFKVQLIDALLKPLDDDKRLEMQKWAYDTYSWEKVIKTWDLEFRR